MGETRVIELLQEAKRNKEAHNIYQELYCASKELRPDLKHFLGKHCPKVSDYIIVESNKK